VLWVVAGQQVQQQSTVVPSDSLNSNESNGESADKDCHHIGGYESHPVQIMVSPGKEVMHIGGYETRPAQLTPSPSKDMASHSYEPRPAQLTPTDGSVRSDEGYHSNGYHDDGFTPPEDSSDSDSDNYVLDFRSDYFLLFNCTFYNKGTPAGHPYTVLFPDSEMVISL
jgi:hypothetical protein